VVSRCLDARAEASRWREQQQQQQQGQQRHLRTWVPDRGASSSGIGSGKGSNGSIVLIVPWWCLFFDGRLLLIPLQRVWPGDRWVRTQRGKRQHSAVNFAKEAASVEDT
jgi:hypothetical protein